jgi:hypothetical protein
VLSNNLVFISIPIGIVFLAYHSLMYLIHFGNLVTPAGNWYTRTGRYCVASGT